MENNSIEISKTELSLVKDNSLNTDQLNFLFSKTPEKHVYKRPAKGGGQWSYVTGIFVKKVLNLVFGWNWSFEVVEYKYDLQIKQCFVLGKLTCKSNDKEIVKMQFGRKDIAFKKNSDIPLDLGNDLKAATTDALKKCASELGIASDVYAPNEFKEINVVEPDEDISNEITNKINCAKTDQELADIYNAEKDSISNEAKFLELLKEKKNELQNKKSS